MKYQRCTILESTPVQYAGSVSRKTGHETRITNQLPCAGYIVHTPNGDEYECGYDTDIVCEHCICNGGCKDPRGGA